DLGVGRRALHHALKPAHLIVVELVFGGVVEVDEIHSVFDPVKESLQCAIVRIIGQALRAQRGRVEPVGELDDELLARLRRIRLMIADAEVNRDRSEGIELALNEIVPLGLVVVGFVWRRISVLGLVQVVLINERGGPKVAKMPIKLRIVSLCAGGDGRHNYVAAVARIARDGEGPFDGSGTLLVARLVVSKPRLQGMAGKTHIKKLQIALNQRPSRVGIRMAAASLLRAAVLSRRWAGYFNLSGLGLPCNAIAAFCRPALVTSNIMVEPSFL